MQIAVISHLPFQKYSTRIWFGACVVHAQPAVFASLTLLDSYDTKRTTCSTHGIYEPHTSTASRYPGIQAAYFTTLTSKLNSNTDSSAAVPATTQHNARQYILLIAAMIHTMQRCSVMLNPNLQTQQPTTALFERGGKDRRSRSKSRSWRSRLKIEIDAEFSRSSIQTIEVKIDLCEGDLDLDLQHRWYKYVSAEVLRLTEKQNTNSLCYAAAQSNTPSQQFMTTNPYPFIRLHCSHNQATEEANSP